MFSGPKLAQTAFLAVFVAWVAFGSWHSWQSALNEHQAAASEKQNYPDGERHPTGTPQPSSSRQKAGEDHKLADSQQRESAQKEQELAIQRDIARFNHQLVIATWVLGIIGFGTAIVFYFTLKATRDAVKIASDEFVSTHRPRLIIREALAERDENDFRIHVQFTIVNTGETRATILHSQVYLELWKEVGLMLTPNAFGSSDIATDPIEAGETRSIFWLGNVNVTWSDDARAHWTSPLTGLFFVGHFIYEDDAGIRRQTAFRRRYHPPTSRFRLVDLGPEHEYAD